jgi:hypothetical protein
MLIQKFWKKKAVLVVAMMFILTIFAINLDTLVKGKVEVNEAQAWNLWIVHIEKAYYDKETGRTYCEGNGFSCLWLDL